MVMVAFTSLLALGIFTRPFEVVGEAQDRTDYIYMGSGGCDGDDAGCVDEPAAQKVIRAAEVYATGEMKPLENMDMAVDGLPVWLATLHKRCLFATLADTSDLVAYSFEPSQSLKGPITKVRAGGVAPVFAATTLDGRTLLVADYHGPDNSNVSTGAAAASFQIGNDCSLRLADTKPHNGSSVNPLRQGGAHVHSFVPARNGLAYACDLGMDVIFTYSVASDGRLSELQRTAVKPG